MKRNMLLNAMATTLFVVLVSVVQVFGDESIDRLNMVWISPGTFVMGSPTNEADRGAKETQHTVTLTSGFYMGKYEVTQGEYLAVIGNNPSFFNTNHYYKLDLNRPVEQVNWIDATNYCYILTKQERIAGRIKTNWVFRLPTEAEWEYACRAGTTTAFSFGNIVRVTDATFWHSYIYDTTNGNVYVQSPMSLPYQSRTTTVGSYKANPWGLYDMHGNLWEWCQDYWSNYTIGLVIDPSGASSGTHRILRGGHWSDKGGVIGSARRGAYRPEGTMYGFGFRIVLAPVVREWNKAITIVPIEKTYGVLPDRQSGKYNLIMVTHGWNPDLLWVRAMTNNISKYLISHNLINWQVAGYEWLQEAETVFPQSALRNGKQDGYKVGKHICVKGWTNVHFIAHSAGAGLINTASEFIHMNNELVTIHNTFLDAFVGNWGEEENEYGKYAKWAEHYFSSSDSPRTQSILPKAYNVDVTKLNKMTELGAFISSGPNVSEPCVRTISAHGWAHNFYSNTITDTVTSEYNGFGFPLSKEGGGWNFALDNYSLGSLTNLGSNDPDCISLATSTPTEILNVMVAGSPVIELGEVEKYLNGIKLITHSPSWISIVVNHTNAINFVSFDMKFISVNTNAKGLLSVYWDDEMLGSIDEQAILTGFRRYTYSFSNAKANSLNMLGFRIDPFTNIQSIVTVTNIVLGISGPSESFRLSMTTNNVNNIPVMELIGPPNFNYIVEISTNLINWKPIFWLVNTNGSVHFFDQTSTNHTQRFYRAVVDL